MQELKKLYDSLIQENTRKVDVLAPLNSTRFKADGHKNHFIIEEGRTLPSYYNDYAFDDLEYRPLDISAHALQQLCSKLGVPMAYIAKCDPEIREYNINHWLSKSGETHLFRCMMDKDNSRVRGILSDKYTPVDDSFVVASLNSAIEDSNLDNPIITRSYAGDDMLRIQVTDGKRPVVNDTTLGFFCGNSEIGLSKIYLEMGFYTFTCTNGLRIPHFVTEFNRKHIGNISYDLIQENFKKQIEGIIINYSHMMKYMNVANRITLKRSSFSKYIEESKNFSISFKDSMKSRIKALPMDNVLWNYISEMTHNAQNYPEYQRMEIEKQAGLYMESIISKEVKKGKYELALVA